VNPLDLVLCRLAHVKKRPAGGWSAKCSAHDGKGDNSLGIDEGHKQPVVLICRAVCSYEAILRALDLDPNDLKPEREQTSHGKQTTGRKRKITLKELAEDKALPVPCLTSLELDNLTSGGIGIPYYDETGTQREVKRRTALNAREGSYWPAGKALMPYAREEGYLERGHS
jgi:hypothetical protein